MMATETEKRFERWQSAVTAAMDELQAAVEEALREADEARRHEKIACDERDALLKSVLQLREKNDLLLAQAACDAVEITESKSCDPIHGWEMYP